jgi:hypothetical protein
VLATNGFGDRDSRAPAKRRERRGGDRHRTAGLDERKELVRGHGREDLRRSRGPVHDQRVHDGRVPEAELELQTRRSRGHVLGEDVAPLPHRRARHDRFRADSRPDRRPIRHRALAVHVQPVIAVRVVVAEEASGHLQGRRYEEVHVAVAIVVPGGRRVRPPEQVHRHRVAFTHAR